MNYYDKNAQEFFNDTVDADMTSHYKEFLKLIPKNARILDAGCGSGRDAKYFKESGYEVLAIDGSEEMCRLASELIGSDVLNMLFQDIDFIDEFDGIWASASLLHVPSDEISDVLKRLKKSLKKNGILYASFKYGDFEGERNGRYFNDLDETTSRQLFEKENFKVIKTWITSDSRKGRENEKWVNILIQK
jgi:SAM-dependent methyltransferase